MITEELNQLANSITNLPGYYDPGELMCALGIVLSRYFRFIEMAHGRDVSDREFARFCQCLDETRHTEERLPHDA